MINSVKKTFLNKISSIASSDSISHDEICSDKNFRQSIAALMILVAASDEDYRPEEHVLIKQLLSDKFDISENITNELMEDAKEETEKSIDLYNFVRTVNQKLAYDDRLRVVEMLWRVVFADQKIKIEEENLIKKLCHLLGVSNKDRIALKSKVYKDVL